MGFTVRLPKNQREETKFEREGPRETRGKAPNRFAPAQTGWAVTPDPLVVAPNGRAHADSGEAGHSFRRQAGHPFRGKAATRSERSDDQGSWLMRVAALATFG